MGRTACTEPHCLYKDALYLFNFYPLDRHSGDDMVNKYKDLEAQGHKM